MKDYAGPYLPTNPKQLMLRVPIDPADHSPILEELTIFTLNPGEMLICKEFIKIGHLPEPSERKNLKLVSHLISIDAVGLLGQHKGPNIRSEL